MAKETKQSSTFLSIARQNPTVVWVPLLMFVALCGAGLVLVFTIIESEEDVARREAMELATSTGTWFSEQLDQAILPLFSLAQFATELDVFRDMPARIGPKDAPGSLPFVPKEDEGSVPTHRNVTNSVCTEPALVARYNEIASTIKRNAGMEGVLVNLQLAPQAVVCLAYPLNNTEDFDNGVYMDNTGAIGHDLLHDPARKFIAQATVPADSVVIAGPLTLRQCQQCDPTVEKGFIARLPIVSATNEISVDGVAYPRWGFAVAIINWLALVERSNIYENFSGSGLSFRLTRTDRIIVNGQEEENVVVLAQAPNWDTGHWKTVVVALETTNNEWEMTVGYEDSRDRRVSMAITAVIVFSALLGFLLYLVLAQKQMTANVQEEQAALLVKSAQDAMAAERELNDYIAHEVRNPLSAAIAASSFVSAAVERLSSSSVGSAQGGEVAPLHSIREDMKIVDRSLHFIDDLLRSMLDMHRAASKQISLELTSLSVRDDVFLPVKGILYQRDETFCLQIDCPEDLTIQADRLRVQQVILNLARNAAKFVQRGYIRLRAAAEEETGQVALYVEDSGPGIAQEKRSNLFQRYEESLDSLSQGTGAGLFLCKKLVDCMDGEIYLDESFVSGVEGFPGTRIVVKLRTTCTSVRSSFDHTLSEETSIAPVSSLPEDYEPRTTEDVTRDVPADVLTDQIQADSGESGASTALLDEEFGIEDLPLPENLNVFLVDDDRTLRKLVRRCLKRLVPTWNIWEASSGEMALSMATSTEEPISFDIIFMDQYMTTGAGQALKGTETTRQLRARGIVSPIICGLSANQQSEEPFLNCGANAFWLKPFPCKLPELKRALQHLLSSKNSEQVNAVATV